MRRIPFSRIRIAVCASCSRLPARCGSSKMTCSATSACRCVGTRIVRLGEARSDVTNRHAARAVHGSRMTLACVVMRRKFAKSCTRHRAARAGVQASGGRERGIGNRHRQHKPAHLCRRRALAPFHGLVQGIAVSNIDQGAAAMECRQGTKFRSF
jgi:hypothetical protein